MKKVSPVCISTNGSFHWEGAPIDDLFWILILVKLQPQDSPGFLLKKVNVPNLLCKLMLNRTDFKHPRPTSKLENILNKNFKINTFL